MENGDELNRTFQSLRLCESEGIRGCKSHIQECEHEKEEEKVEEKVKKIDMVEVNHNSKGIYNAELHNALESLLRFLFEIVHL